MHRWSTLVLLIALVGCDRSLQEMDSATVQRVLDGAGVALPVALAPGKFTRVFAPGRRWPWQYGVSLPSFLILDADGRVTNRVVGVETDVEPGHGPS